MDLRAKRTGTGEDFLAINPKGYVPALALDNGAILTEAAVIVQYIADLRHEARLAPAPATFERYRLQEWLNFVATELHKAFGAISHPKASDELKQALRERLGLRTAILATQVTATPFLLGDQFTVVDGYAFYALRSLQRADPGALERSPALAAYAEHLSTRPSVRAALSAEGLS